MTLRVLLHLLTFFLPLTTLGYLLMGPHPPVVAALATLLVLLPLGLDVLAPAERRNPDHALPPALFDAILWVLTGLHLAVVFALALHVRQAGLSLSSLVAVFLTIHTSAQAIVLAHELIHRPRRRFQRAGRLLLSTVCYEHFYTEHLRGHHRWIGTATDPATARHGERFWPFLRRTVPAQFRSAWALDRRRVLQGLAMGGGLLVGMGWFGPLAVVAHLLQAVGAVVLLEGVNFIEHWGLVREGDRVQPVDSWDSEGMLTYYMLIGLARHGDHHANARRPWQDLRVFAETPKMPWGYIATAYCAVFLDFLLLPKLDSELQRCRLGPYRAAA